MILSLHIAHLIGLGCISVGVPIRHVDGQFFDTIFQVRTIEP